MMTTEAQIVEGGKKKLITNKKLMGYLAILAILMTAYVLITEQRLDTMHSGITSTFQLGNEAYELADAAYQNTVYLGKHVGILNEEGIPYE